MTILVLDGALLGNALVHAGDEDVFVVEHSAGRLEELEGEVRDARVFYLIGDPEVLPLPDSFVDRTVGAGVEAELRRVTRR